VVFAVAATVLALHPGTARADEDPAALFDRGLADMRAHRFPDACRELAESYRLDPHAGGLFTLAECDTESGKVASALSDYDSFLDLVAHLPARERARQEERAKIAAERRVALAREVPTLTINLDPAIPPASTVTVDGRALPAAKVGTPVQEDPGDHVVSVHAPDGRTGDQTVKLVARDARAITLTLSSATPAGPATDKADSTNDPGAGWRTAAYVTAGVGGAALLAGAIMGAVVVADKSSIDSQCPTASTCASASDASAANSARTLGWVSTGAFIGAGAALGAAAYLWFARPKQATVEPIVAPIGKGGVIGLEGVF